MVHGSEAKKPRELRRQAASERILDAAERILEAEGSEALTMQRLASDLGYTVGATYRYFDGKDAILAALQIRTFDGLAADLRAALESFDARRSMLSALTRVAIVARVYSTLPTRRPTHAHVLTRMLADPRNVLPAGLGGTNAAAAVRLGSEAVAVIAAAREAGALGEGSDVERALVLWTSLQGLLQSRKLERWGIPGLDVDALTERLVESLLVGWGAEASRAREAIARAAEIVPSSTEKKT